MENQEFKVKLEIFESACESVRELIRSDFSVSQAINMVAEHHAKTGQWDQDDLICELNCMGYCEVDAYND